MPKNENTQPAGRPGRVLSVEFLRFALCVVVCLHHLMDMDTAVFRSGYLSVDVFFILSGYFLMNHFVRDEGKADPERATASYIGQRIAKLFPHHVFSWIIMAFIVACVTKLYAGRDIALYGWSELLLLKATGIGNNIDINPVSWYISALLLSSFIIYWLLGRIQKKDGSVKAFTHFCAPLIFLLIMSHIWALKGELNYWTQSGIIFTGGFLRGLAEMSIGCTAFAAAQSIRSRITESTRTRIAATVFETVGWMIVFLLMYSRGGKKVFIVPLLAAVLFISMFSTKSYLYIALDNRVSAFLGRISFPMFLNQFIVIRLIRKYYAGGPLRLFAPLMLVSVFLLSVVSDWLVSRLTRSVASRRDKKTTA